MSATKEKHHDEIEAGMRKYPDAFLHKVISFVKSGVRIAGYLLLAVDMTAAIITLTVAEAIGIVEEMV